MFNAFFYAGLYIEISIIYPHLSVIKAFYVVKNKQLSIISNK